MPKNPTTREIIDALESHPGISRKLRKHFLEVAPLTSDEIIALVTAHPWRYGKLRRHLVGEYVIAAQLIRDHPATKDTEVYQWFSASFRPQHLLHDTNTTFYIRFKALLEGATGKPPRLLGEFLSRHLLTG